LRIDVEALRLEEAVVERAEDPGVVRVDVPVQIERERLRVRRRALRGLVPSAAGHEAQRDHGGGDHHGKPEPGHVRVTPRLSQVTTLRSIRETTAKSRMAITESSVIAANIRAVRRLLDAIRI